MKSVLCSVCVMFKYQLFRVINNVLLHHLHIFFFSFQTPTTSEPEFGDETTITAGTCYPYIMDVFEIVIPSSFCESIRNFRRCILKVPRVLIFLIGGGILFQHLVAAYLKLPLKAAVLCGSVESCCEHCLTGRCLLPPIQLSLLYK